MEFEKVNNIPSAKMTPEDIEMVEELDNMDTEEMAKTDMPPTKVKNLTKRLKGKKFRIYKREDATYIKRIEPKEEKTEE